MSATLAQSNLKLARMEVRPSGSREDLPDASAAPSADQEPTRRRSVKEERSDGRVNRDAVDPSNDYMDLLHQLWTSGRSSAGSWDTGTNMDTVTNNAGPWDTTQIAEVAFLSQGFIADWFFSSLDGTLRRKGRPNQNISHLRERFMQQADPRAGGVIAIAIFQPKDALVVSVLPVDATLIMWLLSEDGAGLKRREPLRALIQYRRPRGDHDSVLRFDWREKITDWEMRRSRVPIISDAPLWLRLTTHGPAMAHSERERYVPAAALQKCRDTCAALAARLLSQPKGGSIRVVADFRLLGMTKPRPVATNQ